MKKIILIFIGLLALILGIIGIFLPIIPTTPFLIASATCFVKSSEKLYNWLITHRVFGLYINSFIKHRAISKNAKIISLLALWVSIILSVVLVNIIWVRFVLPVIAVGVTIYLLNLKTLKPDNLVIS